MVKSKVINYRGHGKDYYVFKSVNKDGRFYGFVKGKSLDELYRKIKIVKEIGYKPFGSLFLSTPEAKYLEKYKRRNQNEEVSLL